MACHHHILEIMHQEVVNSIRVLGGPDILLFKGFKTSWISTNHGVFQTPVTDNLINEKITENAYEILRVFSK